MHQLLNTLYVTTPNAYIRLEGNTLCIDIEQEKKLQVPLHHIGSLVCFGDVIITPAAIHRCAADGRSIVLLNRNGAFTARIEGPVNGNILLRQAQFVSAADNTTSLDIARAIVAGKIRNARQVLLRGARETNSPDERSALDRSIEFLAAIVRKLPTVTDHNQLRGFEGESARIYFSSLNNLIRSDVRADFAMVERSRRPPLDRINAMLSFLYVLTLHDCRAAVEGVGLDPQLGFLHAVRPGRPALALDLLEEFRAIIADRLVLTLINRSQIQANDFTFRPGGAVQLSDEGRKAIILAYQKRKQEEVTHPMLTQKVPIGLLPHLQARFLARTIRGDVPTYVPYLAH